MLPSVKKPDVSSYVYRGLGGPSLFLSCAERTVVPHLCLASPLNAEFIPVYVYEFPLERFVLTVEEGRQAVIAGISV